MREVHIYLILSQYLKCLVHNGLSIIQQIKNSNMLINLANSATIRQTYSLGEQGLKIMLFWYCL